MRGRVVGGGCVGVGVCLWVWVVVVELGRGECVHLHEWSG